MQTGPTRIPAVVDALVTTMKAAIGERAVLDGPRSIEDLPNDVLLIGFSAPGTPAVESEVSRAQGLGHRYDEVFEINCLISSAAGGTDIKARRDACFEILKKVEQALKASAGLGGVADSVTLGPNQNWGEAQTQDGAVCEIAFSIVGTAFL